MTDPDRPRDLRVPPYVVAEVPTDEQVTQRLLDEMWSREKRTIVSSKVV